LNGKAHNLTASYQVVYSSSTEYEINITVALPHRNYSTTVWLLGNGTVASMTNAGTNFTGAAANEYFQGIFSLWGTELAYAQQITTSTSYSYFSSTGTSTVTLGPSTFTVTNYTAKALPETISLCNGQSSTLTAGSFSVGTPSGSSYPLITYIDLAGSSAGASGTTTTYSFISRITSVTVA